MGRLDHLLACGCTQSEYEGLPLALHRVLLHTLRAMQVLLPVPLGKETSRQRFCF